MSCAVVACHSFSSLDYAPSRHHRRIMSHASLSPSPSLPGRPSALHATRSAYAAPSGLSRLAFAGPPQSPTRQSHAMTRDSSTVSTRPTMAMQATLQSFLEGVEFATRCNVERRGESRMGSRQPSRMGTRAGSFRASGRSSLDGDETFRWDDEPETRPRSPIDGLRVFEDGDRLSVGDFHDGSRVVDSFPQQASDTPKQLEVVRRLGSGSYAVVYLARSVDSPYGDDDRDLDDDERPVEYGREYALKCLCKKNLSADLLEVQRYEATLHQSLPNHPNIVALHGVFETDKWLFLILEYCPGQDLFYWLEQARDHEQLDTLMHPSASFNTARAQQSRLAESYGPESHSATPPSPTLLSITAMSSLLSRRRLRLISRMFIQMCEAVEACHRVGISHRDIKPENFICCDDDANSSGLERRVTVKITDWGLGTAETECGDFDCGSKPYMAYECRNNLAPTYKPQGADIWSLGIVLLNLLFHRCPWADPSMEDPDFAEYRQNPNRFLNDRFKGIGPEVSHFLATRVLNCYGPRVSAGEFAKWAAGLVRYMSQDPSTNMSPRHVAVSEAAVPLFAAREGASDSPKLSELFPQGGIVKPTASSRPSRRTSFLSEQFAQQPGSKRNSSEGAMEAAVQLQVALEMRQPDPVKLPISTERPEEIGPEAGIGSDAALLAAKAKRRKRGQRKGRSQGRSANAHSGSEADTPSKELAKASQDLARELSRSAAASPAKPAKSGGFFKNLNKGNPDLEAFLARAKERDASTGVTNSAPGRIQQISSVSSTRSTGSAWSADEDARSHWASTSSRRERLAGGKQPSVPASPVTSSASSASSPSSKYSSDYSTSSFTSAASSSYLPPNARISKSSLTDGDVTPQPKSTPVLLPIEERALRQSPAYKHRPLPTQAPPKEAAPEKSKFGLRQLFRS